MSKIVVPSSSLILIVILIAAGVHAESQLANQQSTSNQQWSDIGQWLTDLNWPHRSQFSSKVRQLTEESRTGLSAECHRSLEFFADEVDRQQLWAMKMMDSNRGWPESFTEGVGAHFGQYDQCLDVHTPSGSDVQVRGQYCLFDLELPLPGHGSNRIKPARIAINGTPMADTWFEHWMQNFVFLYYSPMSSSICFPSNCDRSEIQIALQRVIDNQGLNVTIKLWNKCDTKETFKLDLEAIKELTGLQIVCMALLGSLLTLIGLSTAMCWAFPDQTPPFMKHFDCHRNSMILIARSRDKETANRLRFVNAIRFGYLFCAISFHIGFVMAIWTPGTHANLVKFEKTGFWFLDEFATNIGSGISVNFLVGGILVFYTWYPELVRTNGKLSPIKFLVARWLRSTPLVIGSILIIWAFPIQFGSGPVFRTGLANITESCLTKWWTELAYISNYNDVRETCIIQAWYLSADFQLYVASYVFLVLLYKRPRLGLSLTILAVFLGILLQGVIIVSTETGAFMNASTLDFHAMLTYEARLHFMAYNYASSYFIGIIIGFLVLKGYHITSKTALATGWIVAPLLILLVFWIPAVWRETGFSRFEEVAFGSVQRTLLSLGAGWIFYCCAIGKGGLINDFLSMRLLVPFGRFTFSQWMAHFLFLWYDVFTSRRPIDFRKSSLLNYALYVYAWSIVLGFFMFLIFEAPFNNLAKAAFLKKAPATILNNNVDNRKVKQGCRTGMGCDQCKATQAWVYDHDHDLKEGMLSSDVGSYKNDTKAFTTVEQKDVLPPGGQSARTVSDSVDCDHNGKLTLEEVTTWLAKIYGNATRKDSVEKEFSELDNNHDGFLTIEDIDH